MVRFAWLCGILLELLREPGGTGVWPELGTGECAFQGTSFTDVCSGGVCRTCSPGDTALEHVYCYMQASPQSSCSV